MVAPPSRFPSDSLCIILQSHSAGGNLRAACYHHAVSSSGLLLHVPAGTRPRAFPSLCRTASNSASCEALCQNTYKVASGLSRSQVLYVLVRRGSQVVFLSNDFRYLRGVRGPPGRTRGRGRALWTRGPGARGENIHLFIHTLRHEAAKIFLGIFPGTPTWLSALLHPPDPRSIPT